MLYLNFCKTDLAIDKKNKEQKQVLHNNEKVKNRNIDDSDSLSSSSESGKEHFFKVL